MSPNTTPSAPTTMAAAAAFTGEVPSPPFEAWVAACGEGDGLVSSGAMMPNAAGTGGGEGFAPTPEGCQRAKSGAFATKGLDLRAAWVGHSPMAAAFSDVADPGLYRGDNWRPHFERMRREDP